MALALAGGYAVRAHGPHRCPPSRSLRSSGRRGHTIAVYAGNHEMCALACRADPPDPWGERLAGGVRRRRRHADNRARAGLCVAVAVERGGHAQVTADINDRAGERFPGCRRRGASHPGNAARRQGRSASRASSSGCRGRAGRSTLRSTAAGRRLRRSRRAVVARRATPARTRRTGRHRPTRCDGSGSAWRPATADDRRRLLVRTGQH
jgi:hypothetical protein